ncbi:MAG: hypothetical protein IJ751_05820 [Oscillospiraceae bacterium]|nr:hypothetical protein [Oscillospiraceae bacterium]
MNIKETLHAKRLKTEAHIRALEAAGTAGKRYTATMPDIPFLVLGLLCDVGWLMHLIAGGARLFRGFDPLLCLSLIGVIVGVGMTIYLNRIQEKEIALRYQKNLSFGLTIASGLVGGVAGILLGSPWIAIGGFLNFVTGLPLYLSFKPGIRYGVQ